MILCPEFDSHSVPARQPSAQVAEWYKEVAKNSTSDRSVSIYLRSIFDSHDPSCFENKILEHHGLEINNITAWSITAWR